MGLGFKRTYGTGSIPVFQGIGKDIQIAQGGFLLDTTGLTAGVIIPAGTPLVFDETNRTAVVMTTAVIQANAASNATTYRVNKGSRLKVGDNFALTAGAAAYPITTIDTTNADYDAITLGTTVGAATAGQFVFASTATGASAAAFPAINGLLYNETVVDSGTSVSAVIRGTVYARRVPYSAGLAALPGLDDIIYSQSK